MTEVVENQEKVFEHFLELPTKIRTRMIDKMGTRDRCRLTRCSKRCNQEAKASKNYIYALRFEYESKDLMRIQVEYQRVGHDGYILSFSERSGKKWKEYETLDVRGLWLAELDQSLDLFQTAFEEFRRILQANQHTIKVLGVCDWRNLFVRQTTLDYGIESLNSLESLSVWGSFDALQILSKIQHPLKRLYLRGADNEQLANCEQIYQVRDRLTLRTIELKNENFLRLSVKNLEMGLGNMTERDIFKFIRSWQDGTIGREIDYNIWHFDKAFFNKKKLLRLLTRKGSQCSPLKKIGTMWKV